MKSKEHTKNQPAKAAEPFLGEIRATGKTVRIILSWIGEGWKGDYEETDPKDTPLMRMDVMRLGKHGGDADDDEWGVVRNGSFCTQVDARTPKIELGEIASKTVALLDGLPTDQNISAVEILSWITAADDIGKLITATKTGLTTAQKA